MTLLEFMGSDANSIFTIALLVMFLIAILEGITVALGFGLSSLLEGIFPDIELDITSGDTPSGVLSKLLSWLNYGRVPVLIILVCFLTAFGVVGYLMQYFLYTFASSILPQIIAVPLAFLFSLPFVKMFVSFVGKVMPKDETSALSQESFIGKVATITLGTATFGSAAEAKVRDKHGQTHYFMVEPQSENMAFKQGEDVLLSKQNLNGFYAIKNENTSLQN